MNTTTMETILAIGTADKAVAIDTATKYGIDYLMHLAKECNAVVSIINEDRGKDDREASITTKYAYCKVKRDKATNTKAQYGYSVEPLKQRGDKAFSDHLLKVTLNGVAGTIAHLVINEVDKDVKNLGIKAGQCFIKEAVSADDGYNTIDVKYSGVITGAVKGYCKDYGLTDKLFATIYKDLTEAIALGIRRVARLESFENAYKEGLRREDAASEAREEAKKLKEAKKSTAPAKEPLIEGVKLVKGDKSSKSSKKTA